MPLTHRALSHLEQVRARNRKGDVTLLCEVRVRFLISATTNAHFQLFESAEKRETYHVVYRYQPPFRPNVGHSNMWVLSGNGSRTFAYLDTVNEKCSTTVVSSDWLHDYAAPWQATSFVTFEVPRQRMVPGATGLQSWVNAAIEAVEVASISLGKGDWNDVVSDLRPVWELFRNHPDIKLLLEADGYSSDAASALNDSFRHQFELASKFVHRTDKTGKKLAPEIRASREDAHLVYAFATAAVNLLSQKLERASRS